MKKIIFAIIIFFIAVSTAIAQIREFWTDQIISQGQVKRVYFHALVEQPGGREWHYFGTTAAEATPTTGDQVFEHTYVQFPSPGFDDLGDEENEVLRELAIQAGRIREGLQDARVVNVFTNTFEAQGTTRIITFFMWADGTWYYFGVDGDTPVPDPGLSGAIVTVQDIRFPRDFNELGEEQNFTLYNLGIKSGFIREGIE